MVEETKSNKTHARLCTYRPLAVERDSDVARVETGFDEFEYDNQASGVYCALSTRNGRMWLSCIPCESTMYLEA